MGLGAVPPPPRMGAMFGAAPPPPPMPPAPAMPRAPAPKHKAKAKHLGVPAFGPHALGGVGAPFMGGWPGGGLGAAGGAGLPGMPMLPGGMGWPLPPPAVPPGYAPGSSSEPTAIGPWLNVPMLQYGVLPYLQNGAIIEMSLVDPNGGGMPYATMIVSIQAMPLVNQAGICLECTFVG